MREPAVYIMASRKHGTLYIGVTSDLPKRTYEHKTSGPASFCGRYNCHRLVYFEQYGDMPTAIAREKQLKAGSRAKKVALIEAANPDWADIYPTILS